MDKEQLLTGMVVVDGGAKYILPFNSVESSFKVKAESIVTDPDGNRMIGLNRDIYSVFRLCDLLNTPASGKEPEDQIMVMLEQKGARFCLLVDDLLGESESAVRALPDICDGGRYISGGSVFEDSEIRMIIDTDELFKGIETYGREDVFEYDVEIPIDYETSDEYELNRFFTFDLCGDEYAVEVMHVKEIINAREITAVPEAPYYIEGVINLRGEIIPVINLRRRFLSSDADGAAYPYIVLVDYYDRIFGLLVDKVNETVLIDEDAVRPLPQLNIYNKTYFAKNSCFIDGRTVLLLDLSKILV